MPIGQTEHLDRKTGRGAGLDLAEMGGSGTAAGVGFGKRQQGRRAERERSILPVVVERGKDTGGFVEQELGRTQEGSR